VRRNSKIFFNELLADLLKEGHKGEFALMRDGKVVAFLPTSRAGLIKGSEMFAGKPFSVQEITDEHVYLGTIA
ncbi:MAG: hypothetical protein OD811_07000, partial [Alphaproteobacteria bacterium]